MSIMLSLPTRLRLLYENSSGSLRGIVLMSVAMGLAATMNAVIRHLGTELPTFELVLFRSVFASLALVPVMRRTGLVHVFRTRRLGLHTLRGAVGVLSTRSGSTGLQWFLLQQLPLWIS